MMDYIFISNLSRYPRNCKNKHTQFNGIYHAYVYIYMECALVEAIRGGHYAVVELLLWRGADISQADKASPTVSILRY